MFTVRALVAAAVSVVALAAPASAGGPTSAILSVPGQGRTASLYYTDAEYDQLARLVGTYDTTAGKVDESGRGHEGGTAVTVTWLIHDVEPWRVDRIYLDADGGPWIATQVMDFKAGSSIWDSPVVWFQPTNGKQLAALLDRILGDRSSPAVAAAGPVQTQPEAAPPAEPADHVAGGWFALGGLVAGALVTLGLLRLRPSREDEPELDPSKDWLAPQTRSTSA